MDKIILKKMEFYAFHGVFTEENKLGQRFSIDLEAYTDIRKAGETDDVQSTINYANLFEIVKKTTQIERYHLIETIAEKIAERVLNDYPSISGVKVYVTKQTPPIDGILGGVTIEIERLRS